MSDDPFVVHVARLRRVRGTRWHEVRRGPLDPDLAVAPGDQLPDAAAGGRGEPGGRRRPGRGEPADSTVPEGAEACCDVVLQSFDGGVMAWGTVQAPWRGVCRRCATPVAGELRIPVRERFTEPGGRYGDPPGGPDGDDEAYPIVDDRLDLRPMVRDAVVLELPLAPLCREDCRGLCPHCGADRNEEPCGCMAPRDARWASLDVLRSAQ